MTVPQSTSNRVYVGGTFDLLHPGHLNLLRQAATLGEVWVGLNRDEFCARYKRPTVMNYKERNMMLLGCRYVRCVIPNYGDEDSRFAINSVKPRYIVHGDDWTGEEYLKQLNTSQEVLDALGIELVYFPYTPTVSTSEIIDRIRNRVQP